MGAPHTSPSEPQQANGAEERPRLAVAATQCARTGDREESMTTGTRHQRRSGPAARARPAQSPSRRSRDRRFGRGLKIFGAPTLWAQNLKDVTIVHTGMSYSTIIDIARQATQDLGFTVEMAVTDHAGLINRVTTQPDWSMSPMPRCGRRR